MKRRAASDPRISVAYIRVSTDQQALAPEAQRAAIEHWAAGADVRVASFHVERGVSGAATMESRPVLLEAIAALAEARGGVFVVAKRDRLARDVIVAAMIERAVAACGAQLVSADGAGNGDGPADAFMRTVIDGAAAYERALIRARTKAALAAKRARGERTGNVPFGYRVGEDRIALVVDAAEQRILEAARALRREGRTVRAIVDSLIVMGDRSRTGRPFGIAQVHAMLADRPGVPS